MHATGCAAWSPRKLAMGLACVRAVEPSYDQLPSRLKHPKAPVKPVAPEGHGGLEPSVGPMRHMLRDGHEQCTLEADLEAWVFRQSKSLGEAFAGKPWPLQGCSGAICSGAQPHCAGTASGACGRVERMGPLALEEEIITLRHGEVGSGGGGTARELPVSPTSEHQSRVICELSVPATAAAPPAMESRLPSRGPASKARTEVEAVPFTAAGEGIFEEEHEIEASRGLQTRLCETFCCRQEVSLGQDKAVIIDQQNLTA